MSNKPMLWMTLAGVFLVGCQKRNEMMNVFQNDSDRTITLQYASPSQGPDRSSVILYPGEQHTLHRFMPNDAVTEACPFDLGCRANYYIYDNGDTLDLKQVIDSLSWSLVEEPQPGLRERAIHVCSCSYD